VPSAASGQAGTHSGYLKTAGAMPLPGYTLVEPLGKGGFGEVWKCVAPGGLHKAIKFVAEDPDARDASALLRQELDAFQQIKMIRHPFLLTLERVELVNGELVMVMELADRSLHERFAECRTQRLAGIPRDELLGYLADAAEALDVIGAEHGLQHLDVKPANLFLVGRHVKVGDYGLVSQMAAGGGREGRGLTPQYTAPEILRGEVDPRSDQYSLALVYQELLTGLFPFAAKSAQQMMLMHVGSPPDLTPLPVSDRAAVGQALAKIPAARFESCVEFVRSLLVAAPAPASAKNALRQARLSRSSIELKLPGRSGTVANPARTKPNIALTESDMLVNTSLGEVVARLESVRALVALSTLAGGPPEQPPFAPTQFAEELVRAACPGGAAPLKTGDPVRGPDGSWVSRFPLRQIASVAQLKLEVLREQWGAEMSAPTESEIVMRVYAGQGLWGKLSGKKAGLELAVHLPDPKRPLGEAAAIGKLFGAPDPAFVKTAMRTVPTMLEDIRSQLQNADDRRKAVRVAAEFPVVLHPVHPNGDVLASVPGKCVDVSAGGLCCLVQGVIPTKYVLAEFPTVPAVAGWSIVVRLTRSYPAGDDLLAAGRFRTDL
jgi:serine/threonine protein kinase